MGNVEEGMSKTGTLKEEEEDFEKRNKDGEE